MSEKENDIQQLDSVLEKLDGINSEYEKSNPELLTAGENPTIDHNNA